VRITECQLENGGALAISGAKLRDIVRSSKSDETITLSTLGMGAADLQMLQIVTSDSRFKLYTVSPEDFPADQESGCGDPVASTRIEAAKLSVLLSVSFKRFKK